MDEVERFKIHKALMEKILTILRRSADQKKQGELMKADQSKIDFKKKQIRIVDTVAALIALGIIIIYFFEFELFIQIKLASNGNTLKKKHQSTAVNTYLRLIMMAASVAVSKFLQNLSFVFDSLLGVLIYFHY